MEYFLRSTENQEILSKIKDEISKIKTTDLSKIAGHLKLCNKFLADLKYVENDISIRLKQKIFSFAISNNVKNYFSFFKFLIF